VDKRKKKVILVTADTQGKVDKIARVDANPATGTMQFFDADGKPLIFTDVEVSIGYERNKGTKVIHRVAAEPGAVHYDPTTALMRFATLVAVDTNTQEVDRGERISVTANVIVTNVRYDNESPRSWHAVYIDTNSFVWLNTNAPPEVTGWINTIIECVKAKIPMPVGLIVDSELERLKRINQRAEPIVYDWLLLSGFEFVYASADRGGTENVGNMMMARCEKRARAVLRAVVGSPGAREWLRRGHPSQLAPAAHMWRTEWTVWQDSYAAVTDTRPPPTTP